MSDVYEVGGIEAKMVVDADQFDESIDHSEKKVKGLHTSIETLPPSIQKLVLKEQELTKKIEEQRQKIIGQDAALDALKESYAQAQQAVGAYSDEDMASHFAKEDAAIRKEDEALTGLAANLKMVQQQQAQAAAKINQKIGLEDQKGQFRSTSLGIDAVANSLRGLSPVLGESVSGIGNMAERLVFLKQTMNQAKNAGAATGAVIGSAIMGGATLAVTGISLVVQAIQKADEERKQRYEQAMSDLKEYQEKERETAMAMLKLHETSSTEQYIASRQKLIDMFPDIVSGYSDENNMILGNNEALKDQVDTLKEAVRLHREKLALESDGKFADYKGYEKDIKDYQEQVNSKKKELESSKAYYKDNNVTRDSRVLDPTVLDSQLNNLQKKLNEAKINAMTSANDVFYGLSAKISMGIDDFENLNEVQGRVYDSMVLDARDYIMAAEDETEANSRVQETIEKIKSVLADEKTYTDRYKVIIEESAGGPFGDDQLSMIDSMGQDFMDKLKKGYQDTYDDEIKEIEQRYSDLYESRKSSLDAEYKAVESSLKAQQQAYQSMAFDVKSLDEQDLNNKLDKFRRQLAAEKDMQAKSIMAVQERYYKEAQLIIQTANKEIQVYKDKLAALDAADKAAEDARKKRQNEAALRDLNEDMAKQQAENAREIAEALEKYETERDRLQAIIDKPPSQTARIIAERDLTKLTEDWNKEREGLEATHAEKILTIQRRLDEEKLTQQEDAQAAERQSQRESLNQKVSETENAATQQLNSLNNQYAVEANVQKKALAERLEAEKASYQQRLSVMKTELDNLLEEEKENAKKRLDNAISDENLVAEARKEIMSKSQDEMLEMLDEYAEEARKKGKNFGAQYNAGIQEGLKDNGLPSFTQSPGAGKEGPVYFDWKAALDAEEERFKNLPGFATGGIATSKQLAWIAENEPEAIIPMSRLQSLVDSLYAGSQQVAAHAYWAMQQMKPEVMAGNTYHNSSQLDQSRTVHIENVNISRTVDFDLASAQIGALVGGRR